MQYMKREVRVEVGGEVITVFIDMPADWSEDECYEYAVAFVYDTIEVELMGKE